jgi:hypothetical protein
MRVLEFRGFLGRDCWSLRTLTLAASEAAAEGAGTPLGTSPPQVGLRPPFAPMGAQPLSMLGVRSPLDTTPRGAPD